MIMAMISCAGMGWSQSPLAVVREWTSTDGRTLTAEYLGVQGVNVLLKLPNGKVTPVALAKFSAADNAYVKKNHLTYREEWRAWPAAVEMSTTSVQVREVREDGGNFAYTTEHFRFRTDVNLGTVLMKDIARVFELTHDLHAKSPFGILAAPVGGAYQAHLYGTKQKYLQGGGPVNTAGVYQLKDKRFLAPLELMGVESGASGWRKASKQEYDTSTIIHELTHMLTHDMINDLPTWFSEGYAEYIAHIPIEKGTFKISGEKIKQGVVAVLMRDLDRSSARPHPGSSSAKNNPAPNPPAKKKPTDPENSNLKRSVELIRVANMLTMTDKNWASEPSRAGQPYTLTVPGRPANADYVQLMQKRYRTAHLILYYFIQLEGAQGVAKTRKVLDDNRRYLAQFTEYQANFKSYQEQLTQFRKQPGVKELPDGRIQYPMTLTPPKAPEPPFTDPNTLRMGGLKALLNGETPEVVGQRIEAALRKDLNLNLQFQDDGTRPD